MELTDEDHKEGGAEGLEHVGHRDGRVTQKRHPQTPHPSLQ